MTTEIDVIPSAFFCRLAQAIPGQGQSRFRYCETKDLGQIFQDGEWRDAIRVREDHIGMTRKTAIQNETTDDD